MKRAGVCEGMERNVLEVRDLSTAVGTRRHSLPVLRQVSLAVPEGKTVGLAGESGCGKSMTARAVMGLLRRDARMTGGEILFRGRDITRLSEGERRRLRGSEMSMIFQEPMTSLNPVIRVGAQVAEVLRIHQDVTRSQARRKTLEMLEAVGIPEAERRYDSYPHQLSGGQRQRVMIAMAMICRPTLLIADEPTTALDVTVEAQILSLMEQLSAGGTSILVISHNMGVIARICDEVYIMYAGEIVEHGCTRDLFENPLHPYTRGLMRAVLSLHRGQEPLEVIPGRVPGLGERHGGCLFAPRCPLSEDACRTWQGEMREENGRGARCRRAWPEENV